MLTTYYFRNEVYSIIERSGLEKTPEVFKIVMEKLRKRFSPVGIYCLFDEVEEHKAIVGELDEELKDHSADLESMKQEMASLQETLKEERDQNRKI